MKLTPKDERYFEIRMGRFGEEPKKYVTVLPGRFRVWSPRSQVRYSAESPLVEQEGRLRSNDAYPQAYISRYMDFVVPEMAVKITKNCKIWFRLPINATRDTTLGLMKLGVGEGDIDHPDYEFHEAQALALCKRYFLSSTSELDNLFDFDYYVTQKEDPSEVPPENELLARNIDKTIIGGVNNNEPLTEIATYIMIGEVRFDENEEKVTGVTQRHRGPISMYLPKIFYGDFDHRPKLS